MTALTKTITKDELLKELKWHQEQDNFVRGRYFKDGKGCAVGCSLETLNRTKGLELDFSDHSQYPIHLGVPEWLSRVEDTIFEGLPLERSKTWPVDFIEAINVGANLELIKAPFVIYVLKSNLANFDHAKNPDVVKVINTCIELWEKYPEGPSAESAAWSAARAAAWSAARAAAWSAESAESAESAAWSAAESAAWSAAESAAWSAARAAAWSAESAEFAAYEKFADELLRLIRECK